MRLSKLLLFIGLSVFVIAMVSWTITSIASEKNNGIGTVSAPASNEKTEGDAVQLMYDSLELDEKGLSRDAFHYAIYGFKKLQEKGQLQNDSILTVVDFDQPSYKKRMYVIDVRNLKILFHTLVAHGKNTGKEIAQFFSNRKESHQSSLGFYLTDVTYYGSKGYSLKLKGLEKGVNDNAMRRAIVVHGAPYVSESYIDEQGYIGRSLGCPAVPAELSKPIIQTIKNGSCFFVYNKKYRPSAPFRPEAEPA